MSTDNTAPDCSGCRSFGTTTIGQGRNAIKATGCWHIMVAQQGIERARREGGDCGPSARYYEQKEQP